MMGCCADTTKGFHDRNIQCFEHKYMIARFIIQGHSQTMNFIDTLNSFKTKIKRTTIRYRHFRLPMSLKKEFVI